MRIARSYTKTFNGADMAQHFGRDDSGYDLILREGDLHAPVRKHLRLQQSDPIPPDIPPPSEEDEGGAFQPRRHNTQIKIFGY